MSNEETAKKQVQVLAGVPLFIGENENSAPSDTVSAQKTPTFEEQDVKKPRKVRVRKVVYCTIYPRTKSYPFYRVAWRVNGGRKMKSFASFSGPDGALKWAEEQAAELAKGSKVTALTPAQASDAIVAFERLDRHFTVTGKRESLLKVVSEYCESSERLFKAGHTHTVCQMTDGFLSSVATVKRKDISEAVQDFIKEREPLSKAKDGKRPQLSPVYAYNVAMWLGEFADTFPATAMCELTKGHLALWMGKNKDLAAKSRNDKRAAVKMFFAWAVKQDYLSATHRLLEATAMNRETVDAGEIDFYKPGELRALLEGCQGEFAELVPVFALAGLAGVRLEEIFRLTWAEVWGVPGHVEIKGIKSKTRARRLIEGVALTGKDGQQLPPSLFEWLAPYRECTDQVWSKSPDAFHESFARLREALKTRKENAIEIPARRNGFRHAFCTYHFALLSNENLTAALAGNSPAMIHQHYKGLATKKEAESWFAVSPARSKNVIAFKAASGE